jgi:hypothetical protein
MPSILGQGGVEAKEGHGVASVVAWLCNERVRVFMMMKSKCPAVAVSQHTLSQGPLSALVQVLTGVTVTVTVTE